jgi:hypothetical protein
MLQFPNSFSTNVLDDTHHILFSESQHSESWVNPRTYTGHWIMLIVTKQSISKW